MLIKTNQFLKYDLLLIVLCYNIICNNIIIKVFFMSAVADPTGGAASTGGGGPVTQQTHSSGSTGSTTPVPTGSQLFVPHTTTPPPPSSSVNEVTFSPLHPVTTASMEVAGIGDHKATNITAEVDGAIIEKYGSLKELTDKHGAIKTESSWISRNWPRLLAIAVAVAIIAALIIIFPPSALALGGALIGLKLMGIGIGSFVAGAATGFAMFKSDAVKDPETSRRDAYINRPGGLEQYDAKVKDRLKYYEQDDTKPVKTPQEWTDWKLKKEVMDHVHRFRLKELETELNRLKTKSKPTSMVLEAIKKKEAAIKACRQDLDEEEERLFAGMHMKKRNPATFRPDEGLDPLKAAGVYHKNTPSGTP